MELTRRDLLRASAAVAAAFGLESAGVLRLKEAMGLEIEDGGLQVIWIQAQSCSGCSVSLLNSIYYDTIDHLLTSTLDLDYHPTLMSAAGDNARAAAEAAYARGNYVLVVEGAIPVKNGGACCQVWDGMTALKAVKRYASRASFVLGVGTCACYGGVAAAAPNVTGARGLMNRVMGKSVINLPGCPVHPDWVVGTIAYLLANGVAPALDTYNRPTAYFLSTNIHLRCPLHDATRVNTLGLAETCLNNIGCKARNSTADCPTRKWNAAGPNQFGNTFCMGAGSPCIACTEPNFPDAMVPFYTNLTS
jgi:NiFe hydrogenase small subunit HydA